MCIKIFEAEIIHFNLKKNKIFFKLKNALNYIKKYEDTIMDIDILYKNIKYQPNIHILENNNIIITYNKYVINEMLK